MPVYLRAVREFTGTLRHAPLTLCWCLRAVVSIVAASGDLWSGAPCATSLHTKACVSECMYTLTQLGLSWFCENLSPANGNKGFCNEQISQKLPPRIGCKGYCNFKISHSWVPQWQNSWNVWKMGPSCNRDISNSTIYTTVLYWSTLYLPSLRSITGTVCLKNSRKMVINQPEGWKT